MTGTKDMLGQKVEVGDFIVYSTTGRYSELRYAQVIRISDLGTVSARILKGARTCKSNMLHPKPVVVRTEFIKVERIDL